ncbi:hypothetical protein GCM10010436_12950 [Paractinoplanes durhamensis]
MHTARRGRTRTRPSTSRNHRGRAKPQPVNTSAQNGQNNPPDRKRSSTRAASASTVSIELPPRSAHGPPGRLGQEKDREGRPYPDPLTLTPRGTNNKPPTSPNAAHQQRRAHPPRPHAERRSTPDPVRVRA